MRVLALPVLALLAACSTTPVVTYQDAEQVTVEYHRTLSSPEAAQRVANEACGPGKRAVYRAMARRLDTNEHGYHCRA